MSAALDSIASTVKPNSVTRWCNNPMFQLEELARAVRRFAKPDGPHRVEWAFSG